MQLSVCVLAGRQTCRAQQLRAMPKSCPSEPKRARQTLQSFCSTNCILQSFFLSSDSCRPPPLRTGMRNHGSFGYRRQHKTKENARATTTRRNYCSLLSTHNPIVDVSPHPTSNPGGHGHRPPSPSPSVNSQGTTPACAPFLLAARHCIHLGEERGELLDSAEDRGHQPRRRRPQGQVCRRRNVHADDGLGEGAASRGTSAAVTARASPLGGLFAPHWRQFLETWKVPGFGCGRQRFSFGSAWKNEAIGRWDGGAPPRPFPPCHCLQLRRQTSQEEVARVPSREEHHALSTFA